MNPGQWGQLLAGVGMIGAVLVALYEIALTIRDNRQRVRMESQQELREKIDRFTRQYGQRSEVPDDEPWVA